MSGNLPYAERGEARVGGAGGRASPRSATNEKRAPTSTFKELPLPAGIPASDPYQVIDRESGLAAGLTLPGDFHALRSEVKGMLAAAMGTSQDYDPAGEVSRGAYWVVLSRDGGATWSSPLYTGLRIFKPYIMTPSSKLGMLDGEALRVEFAVREIDESTITFPPLAAASKRSAGGIYLEIPLADLERDADHDGLTDPAELRLPTDPEKADTDSDGLDDGVDALPHVALSAHAEPRSEAFAALLAEMCGFPIPAAINETTSRLDLAEVLNIKEATLTSEETTFLIAPRHLFAPLLPDHRVVPLTPDEAGEMSERFGPFFQGALQVFFLNAAGTKGLAWFDEGWRGGIYFLALANGRWTASRGPWWIS